MRESKTLILLSGGAAQGLVGQLAPEFLMQTGCPINGQFGAVGTLKDHLLAGEPCDVIILTQALIEQLAADGHVLPGTARALGVVKTGVAAKAGEALPDVGTPDALKATLLGAAGIYFPDPVKATAGIHVMKVLKVLGIDGQVAGQLRPYPNGATAMRAMSESPESGLIGCTQVTEIIYTPGVTLVAALPAAFELATVYTAAVCATASEPALAADLIALLTAETSAGIRHAAGFE